jgi:hypothetical protein
MGSNLKAHTIIMTKKFHISEFLGKAFSDPLSFVGFLMG